jgi:hypothetical protein
VLHAKARDVPSGPGGRAVGNVRGSRWERVARWLPSLAGPVLIVLLPAIVLNAFWLRGRLTIQHVDLLSFWLPRWCYLTGSLTSAHIPTWLPNQFGGVPFLSDPQSGWLYAPVLPLFSLFSCTRALTLMTLLNPVLAGLGLYLFFRREGAGRPAATVAGLTISLTITGSVVVLSMPFSGTLAWTAMSLGGAAAFLHSRTPSRALAWGGFTIFCVTQVAAAQLTDGLIIAAIALAPYLLTRSWLQVRAGQVRLPFAVTRTIGLLAAFPVLAAALLLPRLALLPRTSIGHGYLELGRLTSQLSGTRFNPPLANSGEPPWWGTSFARGPAGYVGVLAIVLIPVALSSRRWRLPAAGFALAGFLGWLLNLDWLITNERVRSFAIKFGVGELWLRSPSRFKYLIILAFAALAGYGVQAWLELKPIQGARGALGRLLRLLPGVLVFVLWPLAAGSPASLYIGFLAGFVVAVPLLLANSRGTSRFAPALAALVAAELLISGLVAPTDPGPESVSSALSGTERFSRSFFTLRRPIIDPQKYVTPGPVGKTLISARGDFGRYLTFDPKIANSQASGFLGFQARKYWPAYENGRSILFGIDEIQGYSPVQLDRYWRLVRRVATHQILYNSATFQALRPSVLRLFGVEWLIMPGNETPPVPARSVTTEGRYTLYRIEDPEPRASFVSQWTEVFPGSGMDVVLDASFDPGRRAIVEAKPTVGGRPISTDPSATGTASYEEIRPEHIRVHVTSDSAGLVVVRNAFDENWHATVDGRPTPVILTDYLMQGVAVPEGIHTVELTYRDRPIGLGLLVSGGGWALLLAAIAWFVLSDRRRGRSGRTVAGSPDRSPEPSPASSPSPS